MLIRIRPSGISSTKATSGSQVTLAPGQEALFVKGVSRGSSGRDITQLYVQLCAGCHGNDLNGKDKVPSLIDREWLFGGSRGAVRRSIGQGIVAKGMPAWEGVLSPDEIDKMAAYILKKGRP